MADKDDEFISWKEGKYTVHAKKAGVEWFNKFIAPSPSAGKPLESHRLVMLDMSDDKIIEMPLEENSIPVFPAVRIVMNPPELSVDHHTYPQQRMAIRARVRVPDDEGNNYLTMCLTEWMLPPTDSLDARNRSISEAISKFNTDAYMQIMLGKPDPKIIFPQTGEAIYRPDHDSRTEQRRMKEIHNPR